MKSVFLFIHILLVSACSGTQSLPAPPGVYSVGVGFNSICCGTASDDFLKTFVQQFNNTNKVDVTADIIGGCGREGEFVVLFSLDKLKPATKQKFIADLESLLPRQNTINKNANASTGGIALLKDIKLADYEHCRVKSRPWTF